jgi:hypothetical protein
MRRYLVVANETLLGTPLADEVGRRVEESKGDCAVHVVVPASHGGNFTWTEGQARRAAAGRLQEGLEKLGALGMAAISGEVGDPSPVLAVGDALIAADVPFDEVLISTLPLGRSRWLKQDVVHRLQRAHPQLAVTHVVSTLVGT